MSSNLPPGVSEAMIPGEREEVAAIMRKWKPGHKVRNSIAKEIAREARRKYPAAPRAHGEKEGGGRGD